MPVLENQRWERFSQGLAKGETADAAYISAGFKANSGNARRLKVNEAVQSRVAEIQNRAAVRAEITVAAITERLMRIADLAEETGITRDPTGKVVATSNKHLNVVKGALMDAAKLNGLVIDRSKIDATVYQPRDRSAFYDEPEEG